MKNTVIPTQLGYSAPGSNNKSRVIIGKNSITEDDGIGAGMDLRPDALEEFHLNISRIKNGGTIVEESKLLISLILTQEATDKIIEEIGRKKDDPIVLELKEVSVCISDDDGEGVEKKMLIIGSEPY